MLFCSLRKHIVVTCIFAFLKLVTTIVQIFFFFLGLHRGEFFFLITVLVGLLSKCRHSF